MAGGWGGSPQPFRRRFSRGLDGATSRLRDARLEEACAYFLGACKINPADIEAGLELILVEMRRGAPLIVEMEGKSLSVPVIDPGARIDTY